MKKIKCKLYSLKEYRKTKDTEEFLYFNSIYRKQQEIKDKRFNKKDPQLYLFLNNKILLEFESHYEYGLIEYSKEERIRIKIDDKLLDSLLSLIKKSPKRWS